MGFQVCAFLRLALEPCSVRGDSPFHLLTFSGGSAPREAAELGGGGEKGL